MRRGLFSIFRYFQHSIHRKMLLAFFSVIMITISVLIGEFYFRTVEDLKHQSIETTERLTQQSAATLHLYLNNVRSFAWNYFGDKKFQSFVQSLGADPAAFSDYTGKFNQFIVDNPVVSGIYVAQLDGLSMKTGMTARGASQEERARLTEIAIQDNGKGSWLPLQTYDSISNSLVATVTYVQAIRNISNFSPGSVIGVMMYDISYPFLQKWLKDIEGAGVSRFYIIDAADGSVVRSLEPVSDKRPLLNKADMEAVLDYASHGYFFTNANKEGSTLVVYEKLPNTQWMLVSLSSTKALLKPVADFTKRTIVIGLLCLFFSVMLASLLATRIITPLKELSKGMKAIEVGNYEVSLPIRSKDEIGYLSTAFNRMARKINRLIKKVYETELVKKDMEIKTLQSQINPHFLYNTLGIIDSLSSIDGNQRISMISRSLAKMLRYNINGDDVSMLEAEFQQIRLYLAIQKVRFDTRLEYSIYLEPGLEAIPIPKLLIQPLVENSILHGISQFINGGMVRVEAEKDDEGHIIIEVWNNGEHMEMEKQSWLRNLLESGSSYSEDYSERSSIGLLNVQSRIRLLYGDSKGIVFESSKEFGTVFRITISPTLQAGGNRE